MIAVIPKNEKLVLTTIDQAEFSPFFGDVGYNQAQTTDITFLYAVSDNILFANALPTTSEIAEQAITNHPNLIQATPKAAHDDDNAVTPQPEATPDTSLSEAWDEAARDLERNLWQLDDLKSSAADNNTLPVIEDEIIPPIFKVSALRAMQPTPGDIDNDVDLAMIEYFKENYPVTLKTEDEATTAEAALPSLTTTDSVADSTQLLENDPISFLTIVSTANSIIDNEDSISNTDTDTTAEWNDTVPTAAIELIIDGDASINADPILSLLTDESLTGYLPELLILTVTPQISVCFMPVFNTQDLTDTAPVDEVITEPESLQLIGQSFESAQII